MRKTLKPCRVHRPVLTVASGGTALYEVCPVCKRLRLNDSVAEARFHLPTTRWQRATVNAIVRDSRTPTGASNG